MTQVKNMTEGSPLKLMLAFSLPLFLANALQVAYVIADSAIVGRMLGVQAFAAVGATASTYMLISMGGQAITHGFGIILAQRFGANDEAGMRRAFTMALYFTAGIGLLIGAFGIFGSGWLLRLLNTPEELMREAVIYLGWLLGGVIVTYVNFLIYAALRAVGDSKTITIAMVSMSVLNIVLSIALVRPLGIAGPAVAMLISHGASAIYCYFALRRSGILRGISTAWCNDSAKALLYMGIPLGMRNIVIQFGGLIMQRYINEYGVDFIAGVAVAKRMYTFILIAALTLEAAIATFVAQNFGAGRIDRVKQGVRTGFWLMMASGAVIMLITFFTGRLIMNAMFTGDLYAITAVLDIGVWQLRWMTLGLPIVYLIFLYRPALEGIGKPLIPTLSGFAELAFRIFSLVVFVPFFDEWGVIVADQVGWVGAAALLVIAYYWIIRRVKVKD
ncbi:MAG: MATE family efflux transporter [Defluviitaleaceae bacterium]|nr:MATE family efflux transporter [Defluviitaleaceae bacterium]MCL2275671.1 MATE family efflux transporter [Defluviitaleaceae bacterium]